MNLQKEKKLIKLLVMQISPKFYFSLISRRYNVVNNLRELKSGQYSFDGYYPTLYISNNRRLGKYLKTLTFDESGIPLFLYQNKEYYNPVQIIQFGLVNYNLFLSSSSENNKNAFIMISDWLVHNQDKDRGTWMYKFDYQTLVEGQLLRSPWASSMSQGEAMSLLIRAYIHTNNIVYLETAKRAIIPLLKAINDEGLKGTFFGYPIYEEYPLKIGTHTLNGFLFCLIGLHDLCELWTDSEVNDLLSDGLKTLSFILPFFDSELTSYYDLAHLEYSPRIPKEGTKYEIIHIQLLQSIYSFYKCKNVAFYIKKWSFKLISI